MTIKQHINEYGWQMDCDSKPCRAMNVNVDFFDNEERIDETQFSINAYDVNELDGLFTEFCKENGFKRDTVSNIIIVEMADTIDKLS